MYLCISIYLWMCFIEEGGTTTQYSLQFCISQTELLIYLEFENHYKPTLLPITLSHWTSSTIDPYWTLNPWNKSWIYIYPKFIPQIVSRERQSKCYIVLVLRFSLQISYKFKFFTYVFRKHSMMLILSGQFHVACFTFCALLYFSKFTQNSIGINELHGTRLLVWPCHGACCRAQARTTLLHPNARPGALTASYNFHSQIPTRYLFIGRNPILLNNFWSLLLLVYHSVNIFDYGILQNYMRIIWRIRKKRRYKKTSRYLSFLYDAIYILLIVDISPRYVNDQLHTRHLGYNCCF